MNIAAKTARTSADRRNDPFDVERIRADFPILTKRVYDRPLVYLDNGASAQKPRAVIDAMSAIMENEYANIHRGVHYLSQHLTDRYEAACPLRTPARACSRRSWPCQAVRCR